MAQSDKQGGYAPPGFSKHNWGGQNRQATEKPAQGSIRHLELPR